MLLSSLLVFSSPRLGKERENNREKHAATFIKTLKTSSTMNCEICDNKIGTTFLKKIVGTHVKDSKGKKHLICFECQKKFPDKTTILQQLK